MKPIVRVEGLSKQYRIGAPRAAHDDRPKKHFPNLRSRLSSFKRNGDLRHELIWALKDVSFEVEPGEALGIVGRNGAGKSTLLKILSRITEPTSGRVELFGRVGSLLEVGTGFHPELTGRENVYLNGAILGMKKVEIARKFDEIVAFSEIEKFIDTPVKWYSSGMYMRLAFAVAANFEPEILIVDEVLAVGDGPFQKKCLGKMGEISRAGRTVIFVSHNMSAIEALCNRVLWLVNGELVEAEETEQVVADYVSTGVAVSTEKVWNDPSTAPGTEEIKIHSARLRSARPGDSGEIGIDSPIEIAFEFWNYQAGAVLNFTMHLFTADGAYVFAAGSEAGPRPLGLVRETVRIPANFLNDGIYTVSIQAVQDTSTTLYLHPEVLVFEALEGVREGSWHGKWPGVIRPKLEWLAQSAEEQDRHE